LGNSYVRIENGGGGDSYTAYTRLEARKRPVHRGFKRFLQFYNGGIKKELYNNVLFY